MNSPYIRLVQIQDDSNNHTLQTNEHSNHFSLIENDLSFIPKQFTITTQNGIYKFNKEILRDSCLTIKKLLEKDPKILQFQIDILDKDNVMKKFEDLYYVYILHK